MIDIQVDIEVPHDQQQYLDYNPFSPESSPVQATEPDTNTINYAYYTCDSPYLEQPEQYPSASCLDSNTESNVKKELKSLLKKYLDELLELTASLSRTSKEGLQVMDMDGLVKLLYEGIRDDCLKSYRVQISVKNLYIYFNKKGFERIAMESLTCEESIPYY
jgi:hypothetical protein